MNTREIIPLKQKLHLNLTLPGSKSITNRAFLCAALARGKCVITGALESDDTRVMLNALKKLEIRISKSKNAIVIEGCGGKFKSGDITLNVGASGTTTRFLTALAVLRSDKTILKGTKRMKERPLKDLDEALAQLKNGKNIIRIRGDKSSQFLSALLMISPLLGPLKIQVVGKLVSRPYIDTTLAVMQAFGVRVKNNNYKSFEIKPQVYKATRFQVEGDASAASYFSALHFLHSGELRFENLNVRKSIQGDINFPKALKQLKKKSPRVIDMQSMPDSALTLACVAPFVKGKTTIKGLSTLRLKETDRLSALENELRKVGAEVKTGDDYIEVHRRCGSASAPSVSIKTYDDHRMAMSFAVLGTMIPGIVIEDPACTSKTYPNFWKDLELAYLSPIKLGNKNLVLTGMRTSGKSFHGKRIAKILGRKFVDLDKEIERNAGMTIVEMVKKYGWEYFRNIEQKICSDFARASSDKSFKPLVIATGGGVVLREKNMKALKKNGVIVFVYGDPVALSKRVKNSHQKRPSLTGGKPDKELIKVWKERRDLYLKYADHVWDDTSMKVVRERYDRIFNLKVL